MKQKSSLLTAEKLILSSVQDGSCALLVVFSGKPVRLSSYPLGKPLPQSQTILYARIIWDLFAAS